MLLSPVATSHCIVSSQLDAPDTEQAPSFSPERQPYIIAVLLTTAQKTIFWTVEITLLENGKLELLLHRDFKKWDTAPALQLKNT